MSRITLTIQLFGAFREYGEQAQITVPAGSGADAIKEALAKNLALADDTLVRDSALASDNEILPPDVTFTENTTLAILPPVCGG